MANQRVENCSTVLSIISAYASCFTIVLLVILFLQCFPTFTAFPHPLVFWKYSHQLEAALTSMHYHMNKVSLQELVPQNPFSMLVNDVSIVLLCERFIGCMCKMHVYLHTNILHPELYNMQISSRFIYWLLSLDSCWLNTEEPLFLEELSFPCS